MVAGTPNPKPGRAAGAVDAPACGAKLRGRTDRTCVRPAMANGRCHMHGGKSTGPKRWTAGGRYSQALGPLRAIFLGQLEADDILDTHPDLALLGTAVHEMLRRGTEEQDTPDFRKQACKLWETADKARRGVSEDDPDYTFRELGDFLAAGYERDKAILEACHLAIERAKRAEASRGLRLKEDQTVTMTQLAGVIGLIFGVIQHHCRDDAPRIIQAIKRAYLSPNAKLPGAIETVDVIDVGGGG